MLDPDPEGAHGTTVRIRFWSLSTDLVEDGRTVTAPLARLEGAGGHVHGEFVIEFGGDSPWIYGQHLAEVCLGEWANELLAAVDALNGPRGAYLINMGDQGDVGYQFSVDGTTVLLEGVDFGRAGGTESANDPLRAALGDLDAAVSAFVHDLDAEVVRQAGEAGRAWQAERVRRAAHLLNT